MKIIFGFSKNYFTELTGDYHRIESPNHPDEYYDYEVRAWLVTVDSGDIIKLYFRSFDLETDNDYVKIL